MILPILIHTPAWVWLLLAGLVALGLLQMRPRRVRPAQLLVLPALLTGLGLWSMVPAIAAHPLIGLLWLLAWVAAAALGRSLPARRATWLPAARRLQLPGSAVPLAVILGVFCLRYASGVGQALHPEWRALMAVQAPLALLFGAIGGLLTGRTLGLLAQVPRTPRKMAAHAHSPAA